MIYIKTEHFKQYCLNKLQNLLEYIEGEYLLKIKDEDDLHDYIIESCDIDAVYYTMCSMLPSVLDDCIDYVEDAQDYYDPWREHCDSDFYGI